MRLSDTLNDARRPYMAVTDATVWRVGETGSADHRDFVLVAKSAALLAAPSRWWRGPATTGGYIYPSHGKHTDQRVERTLGPHTRPDISNLRKAGDFCFALRAGAGVDSVIETG